jgi:electron transfer flavoprotein beta subunit
MDIVVCAKQVPDSTTVKFDIVAKTLQNVHYIMDPIDEVSLSEAIRIREKLGGSVTAITLGPSQSQDVLRTALQMGADRAIHVLDEAFDSLDPQRSASILATQISRLSYDLVLCGVQSMDAANGFVGTGIAELLGLPLVTAVTRIDVFADTGTAIVHKRLKGGDREIVETPLPAVMAVESVLAKPIYPRLRTILEGAKKEIASVEAAALALDTVATEPTFTAPSISQPKPRLKKTATIDSSLPPHERMKLIASGGVQDKRSSTVKKPPADAASEIIKFLLEHGIISKSS